MVTRLKESIDLLVTTYDAQNGSGDLVHALHAQRRRWRAVCERYTADTIMCQVIWNPRRFSSEAFTQRVDSKDSRILDVKESVIEVP